MAEVIKVSVGEMEAAVTKYESVKGKQQTAYLQMSNTVRQLDSFYDGPASEAFKAAFDAYFKNLETSTAAMDDAINELKASAGLFQETIDAATSAYGGLSSGTAWG